jgi:hypothetical protein
MPADPQGNTLEQAFADEVVALAAERVQEMAGLAFVLADEFARSLIQGTCRTVCSAGVDWYDTRQTSPGDVEWIALATRYVEMRGGCRDYRMVRSQAFPHLVKFEDLS